jgi:hypothetical protein
MDDVGAAASVAVLSPSSWAARVRLGLCRPAAACACRAFFVSVSCFASSITPPVTASEPTVRAPVTADSRRTARSRSIGVTRLMRHSMSDRK